MAQRLVPLDVVERRRVWAFFTDHKYTEGIVNEILVFLGPFLIVMGALTAIHWISIIPGVAMVALLWRNWRRYNERVFFALAERDRPPGSEPVHPDHR